MIDVSPARNAHPIPNTVRPTTEVVTVTPHMASKWLARNTDNRNVRTRTVARYARDMIGGNWLLNGEAVVFDTDGRLLNGQHRLMACVQAGVAFDTVVIRGVATESFRTMDNGSKRTLGDALRAMGETNANGKAACLNLMVRWEGQVLTDTTLRPTISEALAWLDSNTDAFSQWTNRNDFVRVSVHNAFDFFIRSNNPADDELLAHFWQGVETGLGLTETDPRYALRKWILNVHGNKHGRLRPRQEMEAALVTKAWSAYVERRPTKQVRWRSDEAFPALIDTDGNTIIPEIG